MTTLAIAVALLLSGTLTATAFVKSTFTYATISVLSASSTTTAPSNTRRNYISLQNLDGANPIFCKFGATAVASQGFRIPGNGEMIFAEAISTAQLNCIATGGNVSTLVTEGSQP